ncbi:MAG: hypothetical protein AAFR93_06550 [Pseudomonadota bacterium]
MTSLSLVLVCCVLLVAPVSAQTRVDPVTRSAPPEPRNFEVDEGIGLFSGIRHLAQELSKPRPPRRADALACVSESNTGCATAFETNDPNPFFQRRYGLHSSASTGKTVTVTTSTWKKLLAIPASFLVMLSGLTGISSGGLMLLIGSVVIALARLSGSARR